MADAVAVFDRTMKSYWLVIGIVCIEFLAGITRADEPLPRQWSASIRWENDTFGGSDRFYTDGVSVSVAHTGRSWLDNVVDKLPWRSERRTIGYDVGQIMVTPSDTKLPVPDPGDRPYAGLLWAGLSIHSEHDNTYNGLKVITGVVGPWSLAKETQCEVHRLIGSGLPQGWDYQLHNEPILNLVYEHRQRYMIAGDSESFAVQAIPMANAMLGNVLTQAQVGGQLRIGWRIPNDFGMTLMRGMVHLPPPKHESGLSPWKDWGFYVYGGAGGNLIARDITLDGNTWKDSPCVDKEWFVPAAEVGIAVSSGKFIASFSYVFWGKEFKGQEDYFEFGALTFTWLF